VDKTIQRASRIMALPELDANTLLKF